VTNALTLLFLVKELLKLIDISFVVLNPHCKWIILHYLNQTHHEHTATTLLSFTCLMETHYHKHIPMGHGIPPFIPRQTSKPSHPFHVWDHLEINVNEFALKFCIKLMNNRHWKPLYLPAQWKQKAHAIVLKTKYMYKFWTKLTYLFVWFLTKNTIFSEITNFERIMDLRKSWWV